MDKQWQCKNKQKKKPLLRNSFTLKFNSQYYLFLLIKSFCVFALFVIVVLALIIASNENSHWKQDPATTHETMYVLFKIRKRNAASLTGPCAFLLQFILVFVLCRLSFREVLSKLSLNSYHFKSSFHFFPLLAFIRFSSNFNCISLYPLQTRHRSHHHQHSGIFCIHSKDEKHFWFYLLFLVAIARSNEFTLKLEHETRFNRIIVN